jgi:hypothetical protein
MCTENTQTLRLTFTCHNGLERQRCPLVIRVIWHLDSGDMRMVLGENGHLGKTQDGELNQCPHRLGKPRGQLCLSLAPDTAVLA